MSIAYINFASEIGVINKIEKLASIALEEKIGIDFFILNEKVENKKKNNLYYIKINSNNRFFNLLKLNSFNKLNQIDKYINLGKYDHILLRYYRHSLFNDKFLKKYSHKLITEHHDFEIEELLTKNNIKGLVLAFFEYISGKKILRHSAGIITVTKELEKYERKRARVKKALTLSNGIDVNSVMFTKYKPFDGTSFSMIVVASAFAPWHGLDRVLGGIKNYNGKVKLNLIIIGKINNKEDLKTIDIINSLENKNIITTGLIKEKGMNKYFINSNIAFSSLALFRQKMNEASPFKTREYIARGIPFVFGYEDVDLHNERSFCFKIENNEEDVSIEKIINFIKQLNNTDEISNKMRVFAKEKLDWKIKLHELFNFINNI